MGERLFFSKLITKDLTAVDSSRRLFEGVLTVEMKDRQGEITIRDELLKVLPIWIARGGPITDTHSNRVVGKGINYAATTVTDAEGKTYPAITIQGEIFRDYELDNEIWKAIKSGKYKGLSFGGATKSGRSPILEKDGSVAYSLKDLEQYEVAVCEEPAVPLALITQHNEIAKAMAGNTTDRGEGKMCIRCDKFKCFIEKDSLIKIEDDEDDNTQVTVLDEWKNETHPDKNGKTEGIRTTKNSEPYSDVTGSNKPEGRDEQAEALKEEREKEDELENNRGEPQENGATYHGTDKAAKIEDPNPYETCPDKIMQNAQVPDIYKTRKHTCDAHWAEQKHIHTDSPNTIETCVHVDNAEGMGGKVKSEGGAVSTGTEGANNPVNSGKPDKKTIPRIIREFEDEGHGDPFDDKAMDKDDKEMLERADLEEEKKLEHAHDEPDGPERTKADPPEKQSFEGKNQINAGEKHSQEGKNYDREINPGMPGNSPEKVDKIAPLIAAAGGALARGAAGAGRVIGRGAKQVGQEVGADLGIDDDESQLQKATLELLRLNLELKNKKRMSMHRRAELGLGKRKRGARTKDPKHSRQHGGAGSLDLVNQQTKDEKDEMTEAQLRQRASRTGLGMKDASQKKTKNLNELDLLRLAFELKSETPSNVWSEPARGGFAGREPSHKDEEQEEDEDNNTRSIHDVNQPKHVNKPVKDEGLKDKAYLFDRENLITKPFAEYKDFADCVEKNKDKGDPEAYCGHIRHQVEKIYNMTGKPTNVCNMPSDKIQHHTSIERELPKKERRDLSRIRERLAEAQGKVPESKIGRRNNSDMTTLRRELSRERQYDPDLARKLKFDNAMEANNSEDGKNGKMRTNNDEESEAFKGEKTTTIKEKRPTQVIHHLATNKFDTTTRPMGSDGVKGSGAYNTAMQGHGLQMDPRRVKDEKCNSCGEDSDNGGDNPQYEK